MATSVARQIAAIKKSAESMDAAATARIGAASPGDVVRQGDLYLICLASTPPGEALKERQLAPGTTQGSRHVAAGECRVLQADAAQLSESINRLSKGFAVPAQLIGPVIECHGDVTIEHPEHGHRVLPAGTTWAVAYQRAYAEEVRRVQD